ncbi:MULTISPECIES: twin-arginine translocation signal domain-containing protein [unclassified Spirillospora]|uniref:twin-arginine translocation signal domain-containing protein n=1 Tax=unclassified Spirillospora TaxID=2642701 RepID=UPI0037126708
MAVRGIDRRRFLGLVAAAGAGGVMVAASSKASALGFDAERETMLPPGAGWRLDPSRSDEFNGGLLHTAKWVGKGDVQVSDGLLRIRLGGDPSGQGPFHPGGVRSTFAVGGDTYTEVRAKVTGTDADADSVIRHSDADVQHIGRAGGPLDEDFHFYGLERRAGKVVFHIDGEPYRSHRAQAVTEPQPLAMYVRAINETGRINAEALPMDLFVGHVRVYTA